MTGNRGRGSRFQLWIAVPVSGLLARWGSGRAHRARSRPGPYRPPHRGSALCRGRPRRRRGRGPGGRGAAGACERDGATDAAPAARLRLTGRPGPSRPRSWSPPLSRSPVWSGASDVEYVAPPPPAPPAVLPPPATPAPPLPPPRPRFRRRWSHRPWSWTRPPSNPRNPGVGSPWVRSRPATARRSHRRPRSRSDPPVDTPGRHTGRHTGRSAVGTGRRDRNHADHGRGQRAAAAGSARRDPRRLGSRSSI